MINSTQSLILHFTFSTSVKLLTTFLCLLSLPLSPLFLPSHAFIKPLLFFSLTRLVTALFISLSSASHPQYTLPLFLSLHLFLTTKTSNPPPLNQSNILICLSILTQLGFTSQIYPNQLQFLSKLSFLIIIHRLSKHLAVLRIDTHNSCLQDKT